MEKFLSAVGGVVVFLVLLGVIAVLGAYPTKWCVNYVFAPNVLLSVFGVAKIGALRAFCLDYVAGALIKGGNSK